MPKNKAGNSNRAVIFLGVAMVCMLGVGLAYVMMPSIFQSILPGVVDVDQVTVNGYVYEEGGAHALVGASAVYIWDASMNFIEAPTTSSGKYIMSTMLDEGSTVKLQVRQAAPGSADPYLGELETRVVPQGDQADTVTLGAVYVWDATETAPTLAFTDQAMSAVSDDTNYFLNTTDTSLRLSLSAIDTDTAWGGVETKDYATATDDWWTGPIFIWKGTAAQAWATQPDFVASDPSNQYYGWKLVQLVDSSADTGDDSISFTVSVVSAFAADSSVELDCYDTILLGPNGELMIGNLSDGPGGGVTAVTTKVA